MAPHFRRTILIKLSTFWFLGLSFLLGAVGAFDESQPAATYAEVESLEYEDRVSEALQLNERALKSAKASQDGYWFWKFRLKKVEILISQSKTVEAARLLENAELPLPSNPELKALWSTQNGWLCFQTRQLQCAVTNLLSAEAAANSGPYPSQLPTIEMKLGTAFLATGQMEAAENHFRRAASFVTPATNDYTRLSVQGALGYMLMKEQRYDEAVRVIERGLDAGKTTGTRMIRAKNLLNLAFCYSQVGDEVRAKPLLDEASAIFNSLDRLDGILPVLQNLGGMALERGDPSASEDLFGRAASLSRSARNNAWLAQSLNGLATAALERGDYAVATQFQVQVNALLTPKGINEPDLLMQSDINEGRLAQSSGDTAGALKLFRKAASMGSVDLRLALEAQVRVAQLLAASGKPAEAEAAFQTALQRFEASRSKLIRDESKLAYESALIYLFQQYVEFLASRGRYTEALELAESSRARLLLERTPVAWKSGADHFRDLAKRSKSTLLFYWTGPQRSWLWVITPAKITPTALPPEDKLRSLVANYRREIEALRDPLASQGSAGWELSKALLNPVRSVVGTNGRVIVVPDGSIFDISLEALPVEASHPHYFVEDAEVTVVPSLSLLLKLQAAPRNHNHRMLAIGDIDSPDKTRYPDLANARTEIQSLTALFPGAITARTHADAAPLAYREARPTQYSMIHFATHAESNRVDPLDSAVILSRRGDQFKLYAREIQNVPITADLVTISSCRSAGSRTYAGEGLVGFAWAFLAAGASHVVAGLWDVDDRSTSALMKQMYGGLKQGAPPGKALREAQLTLLRSNSPYRKPYYWAPFEVFAKSAD